MTIPVGRAEVAGFRYSEKARRSGRLAFPEAAIAKAVQDFHPLRAESVTSAARSFLAITTRLAGDGENAVTRVLGGQVHAREWQQYPGSVIVGGKSGASFYYHCHGVHGATAKEHGHFHLFVRGERPRTQGDQPTHSHLAAIAVDVRGLPVRLFTTNRWVTGEQWQAVDTLLPLVERYALPCRGSFGDLCRWINAVVQVFLPQLRSLLYLRDQRLKVFSAKRAMVDVFEDRRIELLSQCRVSIHQQITALETARAGSTT